jgi:hypothetical protein
MDHIWTCGCCGKQYDTLPLAYALDEPDPWRVGAAEGRAGVLGSDTCVIEGREYFIRGRIVIPVIDHKDPFIWGLWAAVSQESFERFGQLWDAAIREDEPSFPARLGSDLPIYPPTFNLPCKVLMKNARRRPSFEPEPGDHPLAVEQRNGITLDRVKAIAATMLQHKRG